MIEFEVNDMTCGHCARLITRAVKGVSSAAEVHVDLAAHRVRVQGDGVATEDLEAAIQEAGYRPVRVQ